MQWVSLAYNMRIFVSYTTRDQYVNSAFLSLLAESLKEYGKPFIDLIHNNSSERQARVEEELSKADIILVLLSESAMLSKWVSWEVKLARKRNIPVYTISINHDMNFRNVERSVVSVLKNLPTEYVNSSSSFPIVSQA